MKINWKILREEAWGTFCSLAVALFMTLFFGVIFLLPIIISIITQKFWFLLLYLVFLYIFLTIDNYNIRMK